MGGRRSREQGEQLVREFEQSGMTRLVFCRGRGITPHTLDYYRRKLSIALADFTPWLSARGMCLSSHVLQFELDLIQQRY